MKFSVAVSLALSLLVCGTLRADDPPQPEGFLSAGRYSDYAQKTRQWLDASPDSPLAPRTAMDLLIAATASGDDSTATAMQKLLILDYSTSVQGQYLVLQIHDADEFSSLMSDIADDNTVSPATGFPARYDTAVRVGTARFGLDALGSGPRLLRTALIARDARDNDLEHLCLDRLHDDPDSGPCLRIYGIVNNPALSNAEKLSALHSMPDRRLAIPFENYVLAAMTDAERDTMDNLVIRADDDLDFGRVSLALPLLDRIPIQGQDPRILFWRACSWAAAGDSATGVDLLTRLSTSHPDDPWGHCAAQMLPVVAAMDTSRLRTAEGLLRAARGIKGPWGQFQASGTYTNSDGTPIDIYVAVVRGKRFDLYLGHGGKMDVAYESTDRASALMTAGQTGYATLDQPGVMPVPSLALHRSEEGFSFNLSIRIGLWPDEVADGICNLVAAPYLSTRDGLQELLMSNQRRGIFPAPPVVAPDGSTTYTFIIPKVHKPHCTTVSFTVSSDGALTGADGDGFSIAKLRYGPIDSFPIDGLPMNPAEHASGEKLDPTALQRLLPVVMDLFNPPPPSTRPASTPPVPPPASN